MDWRPRPTSGASTRMGSSSSSGTASSAWPGRAAPTTGRECQGLRRREHRVVRVVEGAAGPRYVASLAALGQASSRTTSPSTNARRCWSATRPGSTRPAWSLVAGPWREALGSAAASRSDTTPRGSHRGGLAGNRPRVGTGSGRSRRRERGDATAVPEARARVSVAARGPRGGARGGRWRSELVREVLGLIGPAVRAAATAWLEAMPAARQEAELDAAARRDRVALARAALTPLGRLLDGLERGAGLPE